MEASNDEDYEQLGVRDCEPLPPGFPSDFYAAPIKVSVSLILTGWNCVNRGFFEDFAVDSMPAAVKRLKESEGVTLCYSFFFSSLVPAFKYDVDLPLSSDSGKEAFARSLVQAAEPWHWCWDRTLFEIRFEPLYDALTLEPFGEEDEIDKSFDPYAGEYYLRVGGRTKKQAIANWDLCANAIRETFKNLP